MTPETVQMLFALLRCGLFSTKLTPGEAALYSETMVSQLAGLARSHDVVHLLAQGLEQNGLLTPALKPLGKEIIKAVYRNELRTQAYDGLCQCLEAGEIPFVPLKGSVLRQLYPESWMRTSSDIDILVPQAWADRAAQALMEQGGCSYERKGNHDIGLRTRNGIHLELHYSLMEESSAGAAKPVLETVWQACQLRPGCRNWREMTDEMFYFYHLAHMAKHFVYGGCGIRTFIDLWLLDSMPDAAWQKRQALLRQGGLEPFARVCSQLSRVWFAREQHTALTQQMEDYILRGGLYGSMENSVAVQQVKQGGRFRYLLSRIFQPYYVLKFRYPCLQRHKWLTPVFQVVRWARLLLPGKGKRALRELSHSGSASTGSESTQSFLRELGL